MHDYIKQLEVANDQLQEKLTKALNNEVTLKEMLNSKRYYTIGAYITDSKKATVIRIEMIHHLFATALIACKRLKRDWSILSKEVKSRYENHGFDFQFFTVESYNVNMSIKDHIEPTVKYCWSFETRQEVEKTIQTLKDKKL